MTWVSHWPATDARSGPWQETWKLAEQATGVKINVVVEGGDRFTKRQAESAAGSTSGDVFGNQLNWVLPGGLNGMFVDLYELMRRDKVDPKQFFKADLESWSWKGKLWAVPFQSGGEVILYNKKLFDAKGVKYPDKTWTYDNLLDACRRLTDPANGKFGITVGQNGLHFMMHTFVLNFGGKVLNATRDRALYGDDANAIRGAELDVDLHTRYRVTPSDEALQTVPQGRFPMEMEMVAMELNQTFRHANVRAAIGAANLDFAPPPKGPTGIQTAAVAGNAWSMLALSKARDAAWTVLKWLYSKEGAVSPMIKAVAWPPLIWAANTPQWLDQFQGTNLADCVKVWESGGHDILALPEGDQAWSTMNAPIDRALRGELATREAMRESAAALNELFSRRPAAWK
jgi:multiple sugar transport system substrate-binding protein